MVQFEKTWKRSEEAKKNLVKRGQQAELPLGPWRDEPDKAQWKDEATGYPCLIVRNTWGALCGYVGVPPTHPLHGKGYEAPDAQVHGGLTFAGPCYPEGDETVTICHLAKPGEPEPWWFGFDCAHAFDLAPGMRYGSRDGTYRDIDYVVAEVISLAKQLAEAGHA